MLIIKTVDCEYYDGLNNLMSVDSNFDYGTENGILD